MKNIFLEAAMNYDQMSNSEKAEVNDNIRKQFDNIIHGNPPKTEQEKKIEMVFNSFVEVKDLVVGDANVFRVSK